VIDPRDGSATAIDLEKLCFGGTLSLMKRIAIALSVFPGSLLVLALVSYVFSSIAEAGLPGGGVNIGLCLLLLALLVNIPTILVWIGCAVKRRGPAEEGKRESREDETEESRIESDHGVSS
jgi:hypothetical protein